MIKRSNHSRFAFALIELAIVLVVIGLLVGSVLVGHDLIRASEVRAEITQIAGEIGLFWQDLSSTVADNLIDGSFHGTGSSIGCNAPGAIAATGLSSYLPTTRIGNGNFVYIYAYLGINWFGILSFTSTDMNGDFAPYFRRTREVFGE
jgi:hypothetical protein